MEVLVQHGLTQPRQIPLLMSCRLAEQRTVDDLRDLPAAFDVEMDALERERRLARGIELPARHEQVDEGHALRFRDLRHRACVEIEPLVVLPAVGQIGIAEILVRDRREQDNARSGLPVVAPRERVLEPIGQFLLEGVDPRFAGEGLVVAEEGKNHIGPGVGAFEAVLSISADRLSFSAEPFVRSAEVLRAEPRGHFVAAEAEVAHYELVLREPRLQQRLQPAVVLHPLGEGVADDADVVFLSELERGGRGAASLDRADDCERDAARPPTCLRHE
jgi:hypothetical protein